MPPVWGSNLCGVTAAEAVHHPLSHVCSNLYAGWPAHAVGHCLHWSLCDGLQHVRGHLSSGVH